MGHAYITESAYGCRCYARSCPVLVPIIRAALLWQFFSKKEEVDKIAVSDFIVAYEAPLLCYPLIIPRMTHLLVCSLLLP